MILPELPELSRTGAAGIPELPAIPTEYGKTGNGTGWALMLAHLRGEPAPVLPEIPGRVHAIATPADQFDAEDRDAALLGDSTDSELARELGITRQAVWQRRQRLREQLANEGTTS